MLPVALHQPLFGAPADEADNWLRDVAVALFVVLLTVVVLWGAFAIS